ncbi:MAG: hypothetical protein ACHQDF_05820, partial [Chitinophagales bacterium]
MKNRILWVPGFLLLAMTIPVFSMGQAAKNTSRSTNKERKGEFYFSWGYNTEWYTHSNLRISQPELGNDFTFKNINGHDHRGWDEQLFNKAFTIPQYNYRIGYIFNKK